MTFRITGLAPESFQSLFGLPDEELAKLQVLRTTADRKPGFPCRIEMRDAEPGETLLLLNHVCQPADTPYRASHAIFVREGAIEQFNQVGHVPDCLRLRLLSLRGYDAYGMMLDADVTEGTTIEPLIARLFANPDISYIHAHNAKRGCYAARIDRAKG